MKRAQIHAVKQPVRPPETANVRMESSSSSSSYHRKEAKTLAWSVTVPELIHTHKSPTQAEELQGQQSIIHAIQRQTKTPNIASSCHGPVLPGGY